MATDSADLRQMWWSMAVVCAVGGRDSKFQFCFTRQYYNTLLFEK